MDELLINYCKENKILYVDISHRFIEYNDDTINEIEDLMNRKRFDDKYLKVIFRINFEKINKQFCRIFKSFLDNEYVNNKSLFVNRYTICTHRNDRLLTDFSVRSLFIKDAKETCCICLEEFENRRLSCCHCSAAYHVKCIENDNYTHIKDNKLYCCVCKAIL